MLISHASSAFYPNMLSLLHFSGLLPSIFFLKYVITFRIFPRKSFLVLANHFTIRSLFRHYWPQMVLKQTFLPLLACVFLKLQVFVLVPLQMPKPLPKSDEQVFKWQGRRSSRRVAAWQWHGIRWQSVPDDLPRSSRERRSAGRKRVLLGRKRFALPGHLC